MIWHKLDPSRCRWIVYSGESVPAGRRERWRLAYCSHPLLQQGGFTHLCLWVLTVRISDLLWIFHSESLMSVWWLLLWSFTLFVPYFWCVGRIVFSAGEALWIEPRGVCVFALLCGRLPVTISFMHIRGASPLIFFMFSHSPQPATRYVSMSVCLGAHTLPCLSPFRSFTPSVRQFVLRSPADSKSGVNVLSALTPLFSNPYPVPVVSCLTNSNFPLSFLTWCASSSVDSEYSLVCWNRIFLACSVSFLIVWTLYSILCVCLCVIVQPRRSMSGEAQGPSDEKIAVVSVDDCDTALSLRFGTQLGNYSCAAQGKQTSSKKWVYPSFSFVFFCFFLYRYQYFLWRAPTHHKNIIKTPHCFGNVRRQIWPAAWTLILALTSSFALTNFSHDNLKTTTDSAASELKEFTIPS